MRNGRTAAVEAANALAYAGEMLESPQTRRRPHETLGQCEDERMPYYLMLSRLTERGR